VSEQTIKTVPTRGAELGQWFDGYFSISVTLRGLEFCQETMFSDEPFYKNVLAVVLTFLSKNKNTTKQLTKTMR
jgi:hypothetical protein